MANISPIHAVIAAALAVAIVALPMGPILMAIPWIVVVAVASWRAMKRGRGAATAATYAAVTLLIFVAAILAPVKTTDRVLAQPLVLPKTELTLAELDAEAHPDVTGWLPRFIHVAATPAEAATSIRFRATEISLGEFVGTIETRSTLRHRFMHCGNGSSILFGGDCCFGLRLR